MRVNIDGQLAPGVYSKDVALRLMADNGTAYGRGHAIEFAGSAVRAMSIEARMSLCNMSIEMGSRSGIQLTFRPNAVIRALRSPRPLSSALSHLQ